ncbi:MAG: IclR family transcriptional regulator [Candidatus Dormibacterales bacterium]
MSNDVGRESAVRSVDRAMSILDLLEKGTERTGADLARELGVHRSTALRLLATLEKHAMVERDRRTARYRLGPRLPQLASAVSGELDLRHAARPFCERLADAVGETVTLDVMAGDAIVPIEQATASTSMVAVNWLGRRAPIHCTASGKVILAFAPELVRRRVLAAPLERRTAYTIVDGAELEAQLVAARESGVARTFEELEVGLDAIAAPVRSAGGDVVAALDVSGPTNRLRSGTGQELVRLTVGAAAELSARLGFTGFRLEQAASSNGPRAKS